MPEDVYFGTNEIGLNDITSPKDYAEELKIILRKIYEQVNGQLQITRESMQKYYNRKANIYTYVVGQMVWLKKKYYKTDENRKLSPWKTGPWKIIELLPNGVNFKIRNVSNGSKQIVHHDRITPVKSSTEKMKNTVPDAAPDAEITSNETSSDESEDNDDVNEMEQVNGDDNDTGFANRYPVGDRTQRQIEGAIPWDAIAI